MCLRVCGYFQEVQSRQKPRRGFRLIHQTLLTTDVVKLPYPLGHMILQTAFRFMGTFLQKQAGLRHTLQSPAGPLFSRILFTSASSCFV